MSQKQKYFSTNILWYNHKEMTFQTIHLSKFTSVKR